LQDLARPLADDHCRHPSCHEVGWSTDRITHFAPLTRQHRQARLLRSSTSPP
jgi:hypothetical protein